MVRTATPIPTPYERLEALCLRIKLWHVERELTGLERERQSLERDTRDAILSRAAIASRLKDATRDAPRGARLAQVLVLRPAERQRRLITG
jgi:hypothetical protein